MEGPQTRALADYLNEHLTGRPVERILVPENRWQANVLLLNCVGQVMQRVRSQGKWLFFDFSHGVTWLCQLITQAKWTVHGPPEEGYAPGFGGGEGQGQRKRAPLLTVYLRGDVVGMPLVAVLTGRPAFYIVPTEKVRQHPEIRVLGPDPLSSAAFYEEFPYRLRQNPGRTVAAALLDQEIVAGLGNMLKCEILYEMKWTPSVRVGALYASQVEALAKTIVGLTAMATTFAVKGEAYPYQVYDRAGMTCGICRGEIAVDRTGQDNHLTWYCPKCQAGEESASGGGLFEGK
jgi:endonuclease VIII